MDESYENNVQTGLIHWQQSSVIAQKHSVKVICSKNKLQGALSFAKVS